MLTAKEIKAGMIKSGAFKIDENNEEHKKEQMKELDE